MLGQLGKQSFTVIWSFVKKKKKESDAAILNYRILKAAFHQHFNLKGLLILKMK